MALIGTSARITLKNILYLSDFSESSESALPFAVAMAHNYGASVHAMHILSPAIPEACREANQADEELAKAEMAKVGAQLTDVEHDSAVVRGGLWSTLDRIYEKRKIDLVVLGTHGRTGIRKLLLGSFAEEIFRRSSVPVLTIGPDVNKTMHPSGNFRSVLFATDFGGSSVAAAPFAVSLAEENDAQLVLLNVLPEVGLEYPAAAIADAMHELRELIPADARKKMRFEPSAVVKQGEAAKRILETAAEHGADLIVLGLRGPIRHLGAATHLDQATAHKVVAHARCPVLSVRT